MRNEVNHGWARDVKYVLTIVVCDGDSRSVDASNFGTPSRITQNDFKHFVTFENHVIHDRDADYLKDCYIFHKIVRNLIDLVWLV